MYYLKSVTQITGRTRSKSTKTVTSDIEDSDVDMKNVFKKVTFCHFLRLFNTLCPFGCGLDDTLGLSSPKIRQVLV